MVTRLSSIVFLVGFISLSVACTTITQSLQGTSTEAQASSLRALAQERGIWFGAAAAERFFLGDPTYGEVLAHEFNLVTPEDDLKFGPVHPELEIYDFSEADSLVAFAQANMMAVRGHTLVWDSQLPSWLEGGGFSSIALQAILRDHIYAVVGRYKGQVAAWDVVNEAFDEHGELRDTLWLRGIGPDYIPLAYQWAHEADAQAKLFYNDHGGEGLNLKSEAIYQMAKDLLERGVPLHGIGFQMHVGLGDSPSPQEMAANMKRLADLGLEVHITEMDVRIGSDVSPEKLVRQARIYGDTLGVCLAAENCKAFVVWGVSDRQSWIPRVMGTPDAALIFDENYQPKPAYQALWEELGGE